MALEECRPDLKITALVRCEPRRGDQQPNRDANDGRECNGPDGNGAIVYLPVSMSSNRTMRYPAGLAAAVVGLLALALTASPLLVCTALVVPFCFTRIARGLPEHERRFLIGLLVAAMAVRAALVALQLVKGLPLLSDLSVGALAGDESYYLSRALRVRDLLLGYAATKYDYFVATDAYGQTSYLSLLAWLQVVFGPTPYSMKVVNGLLFVCGAGLLFRMTRTSFGTLPAFTGLTMLLFLPSLLFSSVSLLKESSYFFAGAVFVTCAWRSAARIERGDWRGAIPATVVAALALVVVDGLRRGGLILLAGGFLLGLVIWFVGQSRGRLAVAAAVSLLVVGSVAVVPAARSRFVTGVESAAKRHAGHVFTVGHVYKLMDEGFYTTPEFPSAWDLRLSPPQALRFLVRAAISFVATPWPWEMRSTSELAFMPEHILWYLMIATLPFGVVAGWRINPLATALLLGVALPTAAVVAATNGNVGTLLRMRGLVTPYFAWVSAVGLCAIGEWLCSMPPVRRAQFSERTAL